MPRKQSPPTSTHSHKIGSHSPSFVSLSLLFTTFSALFLSDTAGIHLTLGTAREQSMAHRHNRRRSRPRTRPSKMGSQSQQNETSFITGTQLVAEKRSSTNGLHGLGVTYLTIGSTIPWQTTPEATWQRQSEAQKEAAKIEQDRCRLFGGEPGDDVGLCYRMLEYFGGLDFIDGQE